MTSLFASSLEDRRLAEEPAAQAGLLRAIAAFTVPALPGRCGCGAPEVVAEYRDPLGSAWTARGWCSDHLPLALARIAGPPNNPPAR
jgi:hypothetical protein